MALPVEGVGMCPATCISVFTLVVQTFRYEFVPKAQTEDLRFPAIEMS